MTPFFDSAKPDPLTNYLPPTSLPDVPDSRLAILARGVNVSRWFAGAASLNRFNNYLSDENLKFIRDLGFNHIRLPINPKLLFQEDKPTELNPEMLPFVDKAIARIQVHGMAVIVDIHPWGKAGHEFQRRLMAEDSFADKFTQFWGALAKHLSTTNPELVFLETINEPFHFIGNGSSYDRATADRWEKIQAQILHVMRQNAPQHTLIAKALGDGYKPLLDLKPVADGNVVYNFHFYSPFIFTHQGASWVDSSIASLEGVPYPSTLASAQDGNKAKPDILTNYVNRGNWNSARIDSIVNQVASWALNNQVHVTANEFGVLRNSAPHSDRLNWFHDVSTSLSRYGIGETLWSYEDPFGLTYVENKQKIFDRGVADAIGLKTDSLQTPLTLFSP
ncbi:glycoside hydrolase family 5 protein [Pseudanabaena sp. PCC 6802]|uniref:glycoside hydrolase family 5 protein n=1 Tax=Pseudanabaena sp. PCC 6802 TaxID=118173 RepID=UPI000346E6C4|nr:cellulase family glycosylhydrolase [Pseudanabaena sp. PCC 6802]